MSHLTTSDSVESPRWAARRQIHTCKAEVSNIQNSFLRRPKGARHQSRPGSSSGWTQSMPPSACQGNDLLPQCNGKISAAKGDRVVGGTGGGYRKDTLSSSFERLRASSVFGGRSSYSFRHLSTRLKASKTILSCSHPQTRLSSSVRPASRLDSGCAFISGRCSCGTGGGSNSSAHSPQP